MSFQPSQNFLACESFPNTPLLCLTFVVSILFIRKLFLTVDTTDENFMPKRVAVYGGEGDNLKKLSDVGIDE